MRMLILANDLKNDSEITFLVCDLPGNQNNRIVEAGFTLHILNDMDLETLIFDIKLLTPNLLILDHYGYTAADEEILSEYCDIAVMDDEFRPHKARWVINHSITATSDDYTALVPTGTRILCGAKYTLLRKNFLKSRSVRQFSAPKSILITLGGSDSIGLSDRLAIWLKQYGYRPTIVTTTANPHCKRLTLRHPNTLVNISDMASLMHRYNLIITSASTSMLEAIALKRPFIALQTAQNQSKSVDILKNKGMPNILSTTRKGAILRALNYLQFQSRHASKKLSGFGFSQGAIAKELLRVYAN